MNLEQFSKMIPTNKEAKLWFDLASELFPLYEITTTNRIAAFMAQTAHESSDFRVLEENLNYSARQLRKVFSRYFPTDAAAKAAERKPETIANIVYNDANRINKLGNVKPGDGWRFRGGGLIQLTGRDNYGGFAKEKNMTLEEVAEYVRTKRGALESALWIWKTKRLNSLADSDNITELSERVNGGKIGLAERIKYYARNKKILEGSSQTNTATKTTSVSKIQSTVFPLKRGSRGQEVRNVQKSLKIATDGVFGLNTEIALRTWQTKAGKPATGVVTAEDYKLLVGS